MKCVPCWKHGGFLESFLVEWVSQWYLNHFHSLHQIVTVVTDVKALITSVLVDPSINIVKPKLQQDPLPEQMTNMSIQQMVTLLGFGLKNTCFLFQGKYYEQVYGAAMGSTISSFISNLFYGRV